MSHTPRTDAISQDFNTSAVRKAILLAELCRELEPENLRLKGAIRNLKESKNSHDTGHAWKRLVALIGN